MTRTKPGNLPLQVLLQGEYVRVYQLRSGMNDLSVIPHRHDHYELMIVTAANGQHQINFRSYDLQSGRVFFLFPGQVHVIGDFDRDGWLVLFGEELFNRFSTLHPREIGSGLLDTFTNFPYVDLNIEEAKSYNFLIQAIQQELAKSRQDVSILLHYVSLLLLQANRAHLSQHPQPVLIPKEKEILSSLKQLIEDHYQIQHSIRFYANELALPVRQLNKICRNSMGRTAYEILQERLLTESKVLLYTSSLSVKEVAYRLGFEDPAYFGRFFKKYTGYTPALFRARRAL
jgi:AraC family transcriptional activator of pobA